MVQIMASLARIPSQEKKNTSTDVEMIYHVYRQNGNSGR